MVVAVALVEDAVDFLERAEGPCRRDRRLAGCGFRRRRFAKPSLVSQMIYEVVVYSARHLVRLQQASADRVEVSRVGTFRQGCYLPAPLTSRMARDDFDRRLEAAFEEGRP